MPSSISLLDTDRSSMATQVRPTEPAPTETASTAARAVAVPPAARAVAVLPPDVVAPPVRTDTSGSDHGADELLGRLRTPLGVRPTIDPCLAGGLRAWLEDGAAGVAWTETGLTVRPGSQGGLTLTPHAQGPPSDWDLRTTLLRTVFRITITTGPPRAAFEEALASLAVDEEGAAVVDAVQRLPRHRRAQLRERVRLAASAITAQWKPPPTVWLPRTGERMVAPLAGGRVVLRAEVDLAMGGPSSGRASVCILRVHGGAVSDDGPARRFVALVETLRSGAAPFRVASYDLERGRLTAEDVTDAHLSAAVRDVLALMGRQTREEDG